MSAICHRSVNLKILRQLLSLKNIPRCSHSRRTLNLNTLHRQLYFSSFAHGYKTGGVASMKGSYESVPNSSLINDIEETFTEIDMNTQRTGRIYVAHVENLFSMIQKIGFASETHSLYLLRACGFMRAEAPAKRVEMAHQMWQKFTALGVEFSVTHFNSLLRLQVECNHAFSPSEFLASMEKHKIEPNTVTYTYLLEKYCNDGDMNGASEILQFLKDKGLSINEKIFNILIKGHMRANDIEGANNILEVMRSSNLPPTTNSFVTLACGYAEKGNIQEVKSVMEKSETLSQDVRCMLKIMNSLPSEEHLEFVEEMIEKMDNLPNWRQDCINSVLELIHKNLDVFAFKLTLAACTPDNNTCTNIFVKELIRSGKEIPKVIEYCEEIYSRGLNEYMFINSAKASMDYKKFDHALALFMAMEKRGIPVRLQTFIPMLEHYKNSEEGILSTLSKMASFGLPAVYTIYLEHVFPAMSVEDPTEVIAKIQETGQGAKAVIDPLFNYYCLHGDIDNAYFLVERYSPVNIGSKFDFEHFVSQSSKNRSMVYNKVLTHVLQNAGQYGEESEVKCGQNLAYLIETNPRLFDSVVENLNNEKFKFSFKTLEYCYRILRSSNPKLLMYFDKLKDNPDAPMMTNMDDEFDQYEEMKRSGRLSKKYLLDRLHYYIRLKNFVAVDDAVAELDQFDGFYYTPFLLSRLLSMYCECSNSEKAEDILRRLKIDHSTFKLDAARHFEYALLLIKFQRFDDAAEVVRQACEEQQVLGSKEGAVKAVKKLMYAVVETGNMELLEKIQTSLGRHPWLLESKHAVFESLIKMHIYKNDIEKAFQEFRNCVINHRIAPCLNLLLKRCITEDDHARQDLIIDLASTLKESKNDVLRELTIAYLDTGRPTQAMKIIQSLATEEDAVYFENYCLELYNQNRVLEVEQLLLVVRNMKYINHDKIFYYALSLYGNKNDFKKVSELHKIIVSENLFSPSIRTMNLLNTLFEKNYQPLPYPEGQRMPVENSVPMSNGALEPFLNCVNKKDAHGVLRMLEVMKKGEVRSLSVLEMNKMIDLLIKTNRINDLPHNVNVMSYLIENTDMILRGLLDSYAVAGDIESLSSLAGILPDFALKKCSFGSYFGRAHLVMGKHEELLREMEKRIDSRNKLFSFVAFEELLKKPELESRVIDLALNYTRNNFDLPLAVVWATFLIRHDYEKARKFFNEHPVPVDKVDSLVLKAVRREENVTLGKDYIEALNKVKAPERTLERAYGTLFDVLVLKQMHDDAVLLIAEARERNVQLDRQNRSSLISLKSALQRENKPVPFTIPF